MTTRKPTPDILGGTTDVLTDVLSGKPSGWNREMDYPIDRIRVGKRMRPLGDVTALAESMRELGLLNRVTLLPDGTLVAGNHRVEAAKRLGWIAIPARILELDQVDAELAEIDENLRRVELTVLEQAEHLMRREELLDARGQRARPGDNQHNGNGGGETVSPPPTATTASIAGTMGISERSAQQRLQIARGLAPDVRDAIRGTELADSTTQLLELARQPADKQTAIVDLVVTGNASNVADALRQMVPPNMTVDELESFILDRLEIEVGSDVAKQREFLNRASTNWIYWHKHLDYFGRRYNPADVDYAGGKAYKTLSSRMAALTEATEVELDRAAGVVNSVPTPVRHVVDADLYESAYAAHSADILGHGKIRKPFWYNVALWTCVGGMSQGTHPENDIRHCLRIHAPGEDIAPGERPSAYMPHAYTAGTPVKYGQNEYVLGAQWIVVRRGETKTFTATVDVSAVSDPLKSATSSVGKPMLDVFLTDDQQAAIDAEHDIASREATADEAARQFIEATEPASIEGKLMVDWDETDWAAYQTRRQAQNQELQLIDHIRERAAAEEAAILNPVPVSQRPDYDGDEWYTPAEYIEAARTVMGSIELDPASCELAQTVVKAGCYLTKTENGLAQSRWLHKNIWLNPPYGSPEAWISKLLMEFDNGTFVKQSIVLVNNATETAWFQSLLTRFPVCLLNRRIAFWRNDQAGITARQGQAIFYLGANVDRFVEVFGQFGPVLRRMA